MSQTVVETHGAGYIAPTHPNEKARELPPHIHTEASIQTAEGPPDPNSGWSREIVELTNAKVVAPNTAHFRQQCGVFDATGRLCQHATTWRFGNRMTVHPKDIPETGTPIPGRWLWGGVLFNHFGHFLVESTSRLWAFDHFDKPISGIVFVNKRPRAPQVVEGYRRDFIDLLVPHIPIHVVKPAATFENLVVAGQGLGLGEISAGTPELKASFRARLSKAVATDAPDMLPKNLYVSRSKLPVETSGILGEPRLEAHLMGAGYTIFHPQEHSVKSQIAHYKSAQNIIIADGSAGHLVALVCRPDQNIAYMVRRSDWSEGPINQIESFRAKPITTLTHLRQEWLPKAPDQHKYIRFGELDMPALSQSLTQAGFLNAPTPWPALSKGDVEDVLAEREFLEHFAPIQP